MLILQGTKENDSGNGKSLSVHHAVALTGCTAAAGKPGVTHSITWHVDDAIPDHMEGFDDYAAFGNIILVDHGRSVPDDSRDLVVRGGRVGPLSRRDLTHRVLRRTAAESASAMIAQNPREAMPEIALKVNGKDWGRVKADLLESLPTDRHFCIEVDDDGQVWIRFGDSETGELMKNETMVEARYRIGNGEAGNVPAGTIKRMILRDNAKDFDATRVTVTNPMGAAGGTEPESTATARLLAPGDMRVHQRRAISAEDYAEFARGVSGVANAFATILQEGSRRVVRIAIDPKHWLVPDEPVKWTALKQHVLRQLEPVRRINHDVVVVAPSYIKLEVHLRVTVLPSYVAGTVIEQVKLELLGKDEKSFFDKDNLTFGQSIYWSQIASRLHAIPGVANVEQIRFGRADRLPPNGTPIPSANRIEIEPYEIPELHSEDRVIAEPSKMDEP